MRNPVDQAIRNLSVGVGVVSLIVIAILQFM